MKYEDVNNENVLIIANRNIGQALKSSDELIIDVPAPYEEKTGRKNYDEENNKKKM